MTSRPSIPSNVTRELLIESGHRCAVCGTPCPMERAHIIPWSQSKNHSLENLICLCANCHQRADSEDWGEKTLRQYKLKPWVHKNFDKSIVVSHAHATQALESQDDIVIKIKNFPVTNMSRKLLPFAIAAFLDISPEYIKIVGIETGSIIITLRLPQRNAKELLLAYEQKKPVLYDFLSPLISNSFEIELKAKNSEFMDERFLSIYVFDVGHEHHSLIELPNGEFGIVNSYYQIIKYKKELPALSYLKYLFRKRKIVISFVCITNFHYDNMIGINALFDWVLKNEILVRDILMNDYPSSWHEVDAVLQHLVPEAELSGVIRKRKLIRNFVNYLENIEQKSKKKPIYFQNDPFLIRSKDVVIYSTSETLPAIKREQYQDLKRLKNKPFSTSKKSISATLSLEFGVNTMMLGGDSGKGYWRNKIEEYLGLDLNGNSEYEGSDDMEIHSNHLNSITSQIKEEDLSWLFPSQTEFLESRDEFSFPEIDGYNKEKRKQLIAYIFRFSSLETSVDVRGGVVTT